MENGQNRELVDSSINVTYRFRWLLKNPLGILDNFDIVASSVEHGFPTETSNRWVFYDLHGVDILSCKCKE